MPRHALNKRGLRMSQKLKNRHKDKEQYIPFNNNSECQPSQFTHQKAQTSRLDYRVKHFLLLFPRNTLYHQR